MNNYIYIHVCCINNWKEIFQQLLFDIKESGLYEKITKIRCVVLKKTYDDLDILRDDKIEILGISDKVLLYEQVTLNLLYEQSFIKEFNVLYIHTKGVKHNNTNPCVTDWVHYLTYFNIYKHDVCLDSLQTYDTVGVNLQNNPVLHYSGNFWWSKSEYIKKLDRCTVASYNSTEFWLTEKQLGSHVSLWTSNLNHYNCRYGKEMYENKEITPYVFSS